jgi:pyruvate/2-oxoglutarate dehydrogenase complex dihydrolipoamide acyltransferase (E2) component
MRHTVKLPRLGDTADDVVVIEWIAKVGDRVNQNDAVMRVETSKIDTDVVSPVSGTLVEHLVVAGDEVAVGAPIAIIEGD